MAGIVHVVVGGQFGSEGKGAFTYALAKRWQEAANPLVIRTGGPNAGHTVVDDAARTWKLRQIPAGMVAHPDIEGAIAAGSEVDEQVLLREIADLEAAGIPIADRLYIDPSATMIEPQHVKQETDLIGRIGSTGKGVGAARADRIMRHAMTAAEAINSKYASFKPVLDVALSVLDDRRTVICEATQGWGLGLHTRFYPKCTSRDVRAIDVMAEVGLSPWAKEVRATVPWVVVRPHPIRVAGDSGPMKDETSWNRLGLPEERTTVTNKVRRVGAWDPQVVHDAVKENGGTQARLVHMFLDYIFPEVGGSESWGQIIQTPNVAKYLDKIEHEVGTKVEAVGTGPRTVAWKH